jgi:hypothetical protein
MGGSGGTPRQVQHIPDQLADWDRAIAYARNRAERIAIWAFSLPGGHIFTVAARHPELAAAIAQNPNADGPAATRNAAKYQTLGGLLRLTGRGIADTIGGWFGREPLLVPLVGPPGTVALLTTPDARGTDAALDPDGRYPDWIRAVAARSALKAGFYAPGKDAAKVRCPLLVVVADDDRSALAAPAVKAAGRAPHGELLRVPGGHYAPFLDSHETVVAAEITFLHKHAYAARPVTS